MKIRSITCFFDPRSARASADIDLLARFAQAGKTLFDQSGIEVQTMRLATVPFPYLLPGADAPAAVALARRLESDALAGGFAYLSLGPALPAHMPSFDWVIPILEATQNVFLTGMIATARDGISLPAVKASARIIARAAQIGGDGFANLHFGALANVAAHGPFLPGAYHEGEQDERPAFSIGVQCADMAVEAFGKASSLAEARENLTKALEAAAADISALAVHLSQQYNITFKGLDFPLAPYPGEWCSLGAALEALGLPALGLSGSVAAAAFIADTLDRCRWLKVGFNGLMLPVLEDTVLAQRGAQGSLTLKDLLIYSAMCGAGLDTLPLPGDATPAQLEGVLLDVAAIALRLNKPLIARLMPLPGKKAGDVVEFNFEYFARGGVLALPAAALSRGLAGNETISIKPRGG